jgi:protein gp37
MADKSKIEWCDATWNVAYGCSKVSAGCENCFAHRMISTRFPHLTGYEHGPGMGTDIPLGWDGRAHFKPERLEIPLHWKKPRRVFVCSMSDLFHESLANWQIAAVFGVMAATPQHQYVVMTKRPGRAVEWFEWLKQLSNFCETSPSIECADSLFRHIGHEEPKIVRGDGDGAQFPLKNVIMCASVENQPTTDERVPLLLQIPARWRGVVVEPMLGPTRIDGVDVGKYRINVFACEECGYTMHDVAIQMDHKLCLGKGPGIHLVICGAETGPGKRPFNDDWALDLRDQCKAASVPFFFKKDGSGKPTLCGVEYHEWVK